MCHSRQTRLTNIQKPKCCLYTSPEIAKKNLLGWHILPNHIAPSNPRPRTQKQRRKWFARQNHIQTRRLQPQMCKGLAWKTIAATNRSHYYHLSVCSKYATTLSAHFHLSGVHPPNTHLLNNINTRELRIASLANAFRASAYWIKIRLNKLLPHSTMPFTTNEIHPLCVFVWRP